jgi:hypothetical protein
MVLAVDVSNPKALFRRSVARIRLGEQLEEALSDLRKLESISRGATLAEIQTEISKCKSAISAQKETDFQSNIRHAFSNHHNKPIAFMDHLQTWLGSVSTVLAQCGGVRPQERLRRKKRPQ